MWPSKAIHILRLRKGGIGHRRSWCLVKTNRMVAPIHWITERNTCCLGRKQQSVESLLECQHYSDNEPLERPWDVQWDNLDKIGNRVFISGSLICVSDSEICDGYWNKEVSIQSLNLLLCDSWAFLILLRSQPM